LISGALLKHWSISRDDKVKLTKCQNHYHHGGVFDTWTKSVKPQDEWAQRLAGRTNPLAGRPGLKCSPLLCGHVSTQEDEDQGGGSRSTWSAGDMARPVGHHLASYRISQVGGAPQCPINTPSGGNKNIHTTLWKFHLQSSHS
jgi:hypothetical protein